MAVVIASDLGKDVAGRPLLRGVSFKLERRDRMTLSGRNGSGKTTLLRMLAGEASIDTGNVSLRRDAKVALFDQRPPRERDLTLREYVLSGAKEIVAVEEDLARLEQAMAGGAHDEATLRGYAAAQQRLEAHGGYRWRDQAMATRWRSPPDSERGCRSATSASPSAAIHDSTAVSSDRPSSRSVSAISARTVGRNSRLDGSWGT